MAELGLNPRREMEEWVNIKDSGVAYPFILGGRPLGANKWLLVDIQASEETIDNAGNILALTLNLKFDEYVRPGSAQSSTGSSGSSSSSSKAGASVNMTPLNPYEKEQLK
jgi:hypothetical protein